MSSSSLMVAILSTTCLICVMVRFVTLMKSLLINKYKEAAIMIISKQINCSPQLIKQNNTFKFAFYNFQKYYMKNILSPESLVKYEPSVEIYQNMKAYHQEKPKNETNSPTPKIEQIINSILPPRDWTDHNNKLHIQYVSHQPSSREDVLELTQHLDIMLDDRQAKMTGICPIRQELYSQAFDELIRQVAVDCPERGLLLMRVRDQHKMTLAAYETIYQSSIAYGMRKQVESEIGNDTIEQEYSSLCKLKQEMQAKKSLLLCKKDLLEKQIKQSKLMECQKREEEIRFLKLQRQNMSKFLQAVKSEFHSNY